MGIFINIFISLYFCFSSSQTNKLNYSKDLFLSNVSSGSECSPSVPLTVCLFCMEIMIVTLSSLMDGANRTLENGEETAQIIGHNQQLSANEQKKYFTQHLFKTADCAICNGENLKYISYKWPFISCTNISINENKTNIFLRCQNIFVSHKIEKRK